MPSTIVCIYADCACVYGDVTHLGVGIFSQVNKQPIDKWSGYRYIGTGTVPEGEFKALYFALSMAVIIKSENPTHCFRLFADAQTIVRCFNGEYKCQSKFKPILKQLHSLRDQLGDSLLGITWVRRKVNIEADKLSKLAIADYKLIK